MTHLNYTAYEKVENLNNFTKKSFNQYCKNKIEECSNQIDFLKKNIIKNDWTGNVCEIGSGNGKLLFRLEKEKLINKAIGYEISKSRYKFSKQFKRYIKSKNVIIKNNNFIDMEVPKEKFDLIIGVDVVFNLISAVSLTQAKKILQLSYLSLRKNGFLILEVASYEKIISKLKKNKNYKKTFYFDEADPFKLVNHTYELKNNNLLIKKEFLSKKGYFDYFMNLLTPISKNFWKNLVHNKITLSKKWKLKIYNYWKQKNDTIEQEYIVILQKRS